MSNLTDILLLINELRMAKDDLREQLYAPGVMPSDIDDLLTAIQYIDQEINELQAEHYKQSVLMWTKGKTDE